MEKVFIDRGRRREKMMKNEKNYVPTVHYRYNGHVIKRIKSYQKF